MQTSKKVLIIRPTVHIEIKDGRKFVEAVQQSITDFGVVVLPNYFEYEFGEIDGVIWDKQETEKKPEVNLDDILTRIELRKMNITDDNPFNESFVNGFNNGLCVTKDIVRTAFKK